MNSENKKQIKDAIYEAGLHLQDKLTPHPIQIPRNSWAYVCMHIKQKFGKSYALCDDTQAKEILYLIEWLKANPK